MDVEDRGLKWSPGARGAVGIAAAALARPGRAFADACAQVCSRRLANGLNVLVWSDHNIPNIALYNIVRVGSRNEGTGTSGLAHFFEHMMFNGTTHRAAGEFDRLMEAQGVSK